MNKISRILIPTLVIISMLLSSCASGGGGSSATSAPTTGASGGAAAQPTATTAASTGGTQPTATTAAAGGQPTATTTAGAGGAQPTATGAAGAAAGGQAPDLGQCTNVSLQYWNPFTGPDGPFMGQLVDAFNAANPQIKVTMTSQGDYYTQLTTAAAADTLPDVAIVHADQVATQVFRNVLRPIDNLVTEIGVQGTDYPDPVWAAGEVAGKRYSIPLDIHPMTMFYNADVLKAAGFDNPPKTADEFAKVADAANKGDVKGFDITGGFPVQQQFQMLLHQFGGNEFSEDGKTITWNSEAGVKALQWMKDAQTKWSEPNLEVDAELNAFKAGSAAMIWNGIWQITNVTGSAVEFKGMATSVPQIGTQMAVWAGSHQLTLPAHKTVDECKDKAAGIFIKYVVDNSVTWAKAGQIPASNTVRNSAEFKAIEPQASIAPSVESAFFPPSIPGISDALAPLGEAVGSVMNGTSTDIKKALDDAATRGAEILKQNEATYGTTPKTQ